MFGIFEWNTVFKRKMLSNVFMYIIMFHESCALFNFLVVAHSGRKVPDKQGRGLEKS